MALSWSDYCKCLVPMRQYFGKNVFSDDQVRKGYDQWKFKSQDALIQEVNISISTNIIFNLYEPVVAAKRPERAVWRGESYYQTEDYLSKFLALKGCKSLSEALEKEIATQRSKK